MNTTELPSTPTQEHISTDLNVSDRCDRCNAQAYMRATNESFSGELLFCAHHGNEVKKSLQEKNWTILDQSDRIR